MGEMTNAHRILVGKPEGKNLAERQRRTGEHSIKIYLKERGYECMNWIHVAQDRDYYSEP
jgi:hypothetical protein